METPLLESTRTDAVNVKDLPVPLLMGLLVDLANDAAVSVPSTNALLDGENLNRLLPTHWEAPLGSLVVASTAESLQ
jgi:hypothetical protein